MVQPKEFPGARPLDDLAEARALSAFCLQEFNREADPLGHMPEANWFSLDFEILEHSVEDADSDGVGFERNRMLREHDSAQERAGKGDLGHGGNPAVQEQALGRIDAELERH